MPPEPIDYQAMTQRQQATWATGDFNEIGHQVVPVSEALCKSVDPRPSQRVLDVACGSGNAALIFARRYCDVTGIDFVPALIDRAQARAVAEGMHIDFRVGDAQALPFSDATFAVVISVFGVVFAPDQERVASELLRVCRPGGKIGLSCLMPAGTGENALSILAKYLPPSPQASKPSTRWGTEAGLADLLGHGASAMRIERRLYTAYYRSITHAIEVWGRHFGPVARALANLDTAAQETLRRDLATMWERRNRATDGTLEYETEYLEAVITRR